VERALAGNATLTGVPFATFHLRVNLPETRRILVICPTMGENA
jgi:hypothetical protein